MIINITYRKNSKRMLEAMPRKTSLVPSNTSSYDSSNEDNEWLSAIEDVFTKFAKLVDFIIVMVMVNNKKFLNILIKNLTIREI